MTGISTILRVVAADALRDHSDPQLVERLLAGRDGAAFEAIVRRHGTMVYRVCQRVLKQEQDAEDAFQATFLVLARRLHTVRRRASLASWLHGVARRTALKARERAATRHHYERKAAAEKFPSDEVPWGELRGVLDAELQRLPERWRSPLILCYLEGRTQDEASRQLGWSERTLRRRLEEARSALGRLLAGRGITAPAALSAVLLSDCVAPAALAPGLVGSMVEAAAPFTTGKAGAIAAPSPEVAALTEGVLKMMFVSKLKVVALAVSLAAVLTVAAGGLLDRSRGNESPPEKDRAQSAPVQAPSGREGGKSKDASAPITIKADAYLTQVAWSSDGKTVLTVSQIPKLVELRLADGTTAAMSVPEIAFNLWDAKTGAFVRSLGEVEDNFAGTFAFSRDGRSMAVAVSKSIALRKVSVQRPETEVRLMDTRTWEEKARFTVADLGIERPELVFEDRGQAALRDVVKVPEFWKVTTNDYGPWIEHPFVALSPDGRRLLVGGLPNGESDKRTAVKKVSLWDVEKKKKIDWQPKHLSGSEQVIKQISGLAFSPDGKMIAISEEKRVRLFDAQTGEPRAAFEGEVAPYFGVRFSSDGRNLVVGEPAKAVKVWDADEGRVRLTLKGDKGSIDTIAFSPDGKQLATGGGFEQEKGKRRAEIVLWDIETGKKRTLSTDFSLGITSLAFSPDGKTLAVAGGVLGRTTRDKTAGELRLIPLE